MIAWFQFSTDLHAILQALFVQKIPNSPEHFVNLYTVFQKLNHTPSSKVKYDVPL